MLPTTQILDLSDQRIAYVDVGPRDALTLLMLHGGAVDKRSWHPQLDAFPHHRVLAIDARGHGESSDAEAPHRLADDVIALMDALEIDRAIPVGVSMGGGTATDLALEHPGRVAALVVSGTGTSEPRFSDPWVLATFADWKRAEGGGDLEAWIEVFQRFTVGPERSPEDVDPEVRELIGTMAKDTVLHHLRRGPDGSPLPPHPPTPVTDTWERLPSITAPVLALSGVHDSVDHRSMGRVLAESVGGPGRHVEISRSAHYPNLENPSAFEAAVRELLSEL